MEENEGKDLAKDMKDEVVLQEKYYENVKLELEKIILSNVTLAEKHIQREEKGKEIVTYDIYIKFKEEDVVIASIDENGKLIPNEALLKDEKYTSEEQRKLGDMINLLGLQKEEVDLQNLKQELQKLQNYYQDDELYMKNKTIIASIRNSIAHGTYEIIPGPTIEDAKLIFTNIYEKKLILKVEITVIKFLEMMDNNLLTIQQYLNEEETKQTNQKVI